MQPKKGLRFVDIFWLFHLLNVTVYNREYGDGKTPTIHQIISLVNNQIVNDSIPIAYLSPITGGSQIASVIERLREHGFIVPSKKLIMDEDRVRALFSKIGSSWHLFPLSIPVGEDQDTGLALDFNNATYYDLGGKDNGETKRKE